MLIHRTFTASTHHGGSALSQPLPTARLPLATHAPPVPAIPAPSIPPSEAELDVFRMVDSIKRFATATGTSMHDKPRITDLDNEDVANWQDILATPMGFQNSRTAIGLAQGLANASSDSEAMARQAGALPGTHKSSVDESSSDESSSESSDGEGGTGEGFGGPTPVTGGTVSIDSDTSSSDSESSD
jgi:hypothetical protein